jgi:SSS family solute:Na+ symporter
MLAPFLYAYLVGGLVFCAGLFFAWKGGYINGSARGLRNLLVCLFVALFFMSIQGYLQFAPMKTLPAETYTGGAEHVIESVGNAHGEPIDYAIMIVYFVAILAVGTWFSRRQKTTKDFFFGGQRFSWWLIAFSLIATTVGSYSFVKYSTKGFEFGLSSSQTYLNDWIWFPLLAFGWLPILYFSRVTSIPEYFERRFDRRVRLLATICVLGYLIGYVGVNLFTMGKVLNALLGWDIPLAALLVAAISCTYVTAGGQTSVIMTDLLQGVMLLLTGALILFLGADHLGGFTEFWQHLPRSHRLAYPNFNESSSFPAVGIFWQDAIANSAMFYFLNQGIMMRFVAAKSLAESRKAVLALVVVLMTVGACVVGGGGWVARALVHAGQLPADIESGQAFYVAAEFISRPGVFGLILAALTAALMSTVDTLITAVSAIVVNDVYKQYISPESDDRAQLRVARISSVSVTILGVALVPLFMSFDSIYDAHGAFTAAITPPLVVTLFLSVFWRRFTRTAALWTMGLGTAAIALSLVIPEVITPFAHGVPMKDFGEDAGLFAGMKQYKFMRACYGICVCSAIGIVVSLFTKPESLERQRGLVWGTVSDALRSFKGSAGSEDNVSRARALPIVAVEPLSSSEDTSRPAVRLSSPLAAALEVKLGDLVYITDTRWWLGGLRSTHAIVNSIKNVDDDQSTVEMDPSTLASVASSRRSGLPVLVERLY